MYRLCVDRYGLVGGAAWAAVLLLVFVRLEQIVATSKLDQEVWVNPDAVAQLRTGLHGRGTTIVFSTGTFIEVEGSPEAVAARLEHPSH